jgi:lysophospholipase L1-like esterase
MAIRPGVTVIALLAGSLLVGLALVELSLRALYPPPIRFLYPQEFYEVDPEIGHELRPTQRAFTHDRPVSINSLGLRDREFTPEPPPGTLRVLALGDSQTFGNGLRLSETWPKQLERRLEEADNARWEVINAGIPATDTWQHEILLARLLRVTNPHFVALALYINDVVPRPEHRTASASGQTNTWSKRLAYLLKRSALVTWIYYRILLPWQARRLEREGSLEEAVLVGRRTERAEQAWRQVEQSLTNMKQLTDARGIPLLVAVLPRRDQVSGQHPGLSFGERAHVIAERHGITSLDLLPSLSERYQVRGEALFIPWDGHNSAVANQVVAEHLAPLFQDLAKSIATQPAGRQWSQKLNR